MGLATPATAQSSTTPLRIILPAGAGSGQDAIVHAGHNALASALGRPVVVENLPGSGGVIGTTQLVKAAPDGNTIAFVSNNHVVNPSVYKKMPYDSVKDITPITILGETPFLLVVNPNRIPANRGKEMVALLKSKPDQYNFASSGNGTILHMAAEMFNGARRREGQAHSLSRRRVHDGGPAGRTGGLWRSGSLRGAGASQGRHAAGLGGHGRKPRAVAAEPADAEGAGRAGRGGRLAGSDRTGPVARG